MPAMPFSLTDKTIIVTGASSGIGRECAISCSRQGATVALLGRDRARLEETRASMQEPGRHVVCAFDLCDCDAHENVVSEIVARSGRISGLVNCAGISTTMPLRMLTTEKLQHFSQINVHAPIMLSKSAVKPSFVSADGASIIFISSVMGAVGEVGKTLYSMTKGALLSVSRSLALELAPKKIRVNCISPGVVETPMSENAVYSQTPEALDRIKSLHPLGLGRVDDVAHACIFLLSDESRWITGTNLFVDGGYTAR